MLLEKANINIYKNEKKMKNVTCHSIFWCSCPIFFFFMKEKRACEGLKVPCPSLSLSLSLCCPQPSLSGLDEGICL